jgi:phospholipase/carboxylesterase
VIFLHGYGSNGDDLISLAPYFARMLPKTQFVSLDAPGRVPGYPEGRQWFGVSRLDPGEMEQGVRSVAPLLDTAIDAEAKRYNVPLARVALVGFSQGTMMALHVGLRRTPLAGIVGYSGMLATGGTPAAEAKSKPPILLVHGDQDDMLPLGRMFEALEGLAVAEIPAQFHISYNVPHAISPDGIAAGGAFLATMLR